MRRGKLIGSIGSRATEQSVMLQSSGLSSGKGEKKEETEEKDDGMHQKERRFGTSSGKRKSVNIGVK